VNSAEVEEIITTLNQALKHLDQLIVNVDNQVEPLSAGAQGTLKDFSTLARNADKEIKPLTAKARKGIDDIQKLVNNVNEEVKPLSTKAQGALVQGRNTLATAEGLIKEDSPLIYNAEVTLKELSAAARAIRIWAQYLERHPEALVRGRGGRR
jgi:paraquat-inducible protein B